MILRCLITQTECEAYVMDGRDYREGHPAFHAFCIHEQRGYYLVVESPLSWTRQTIIGPRHANNYILMEATDEEKQKLIEGGYQMIGLK